MNPFLLATLAAFVFASCSSAKSTSENTSAKLQTAQAAALTHEFFNHPDDPSQKIEIFWMKPSGKGPFPAILAVHGHQGPPRPGGAIYPQHWFQRMAGYGFVGFAISQPGYGHSDGLPDYCGPFTQHAVEEALKFIRKISLIDPARVALDGVSRGAVVASMVATRTPELAALILEVGSYDLADTYNRLRKSESMKCPLSS